MYCIDTEALVFMFNEGSSYVVPSIFDILYGLIKKKSKYYSVTPGSTKRTQHIENWEDHVTSPYNKE